ncbi:MAG: DUF58 domain-containing protein [Anaerolineae bacterium]|nr:DUF58 domain-containing protein [Anaerolineae bacterium]
MLNPLLLRRIRRIELRTHRLVHNIFSGAYQSIYKGRGLSFASVRPYVPGDDVRSIDWKVTARTGEPYIKEFVEERELTLMLVVDGSASVLFGTQDRQKRDFAAELGSVLAYTANSNNDRAGMIIFSDRIEHYLPAQKNRNHILRLIRDLLTFETQGTGTDLSQALKTINRVLRPGAIVFILSDFLMPPETYQRDLLLTSKRHETVAVVLSDPLEESFPDVGLMGLQDAESGDVKWVDTSSVQWQRQFRRQRNKFAVQRDTALKQAGVERVDIPPDGDYVRALIHFFQKQARKRRR